MARRDSVGLAFLKPIGLAVAVALASGSAAPGDGVCGVGSLNSSCGDADMSSLLQQQRRAAGGAGDRLQLNAGEGGASGSARHGERRSKAYSCNPCGEGIPNRDEPQSNGAYATEKLLKDSTSLLLGLVPTEFSVLTKAGMFLMDGVSGVSAGDWNLYLLNQDLVAMQEYLVCKMEATVGDYFAEYIEPAALNQFNGALYALERSWYDTCPMRACLNYTNLPADLRKDAGGQPCCGSNPDPMFESDCQKYTDDQIAAGKAPCGHSKDHKDGVCSTDKKCYLCPGFGTVQAQLETTIAHYYNNPFLSDGGTLDAYWNVDATLAYAKGTTFMMILFQAAYLVGLEGQVAGVSVSFATEAVKQLQERYDWLTSMQSAKETVGNSSTFYDVEWGDETCYRDYDAGGRYCNTDLKEPIGYEVRTGCDTSEQAFHFVRMTSDDKDFCEKCLVGKTTKKDENDCKVTLYQDAKYKGYSKSYYGSTSYIGDKMNNEKEGFSSFKLSGCQGVIFYDDADYKPKPGTPAYIGRDYITKKRDNEFSSFKVWVDGEVTGGEGCVCEALTSSQSAEAQPCQMTRKTREFDGMTGAKALCLDWSKDATKVWGKNYKDERITSHSVMSYNEAMEKASRKLQATMVEEMENVKKLIEVLQQYIEAGGPDPSMFGWLQNNYYPLPTCSAQPSTQSKLTQAL